MKPPLNEPAPAATKPSNCPPRIVLLDDVPEARESIRIIIQAYWANAEIVECDNGDEAWKIVQESPPDLLISDLTHPGMGGEELSKRIGDAHAELPVLLISTFQHGLDSLREQHQTNPQSPRGFLAKPFTVEALGAEIQRLISTRVSGRPELWSCQPIPRIVLVDDEDFIHELVDAALREVLTNYSLVKFLNRDEAWEELLREPPNLLITDMLSTNVPGRTEQFGMSGGELLQRLAERRVTFPILVVSGSFSISGWEAYAKRCARPHLNVSFLTKPYTMDLFRLAVRKCLGAE